MAIAVALGGGFEDGPRALFVAGAGIALLVALRRDVETARRLAQAPVVVGLLALAGLSCVSAIWTVAEAEAAARWGLVIAAYAAILIAAGVESRTNPRAIAVVIAGSAALAGLLGLVAAALGTTPYAERIGGSWRPGGFFEYPPALALAQVAALPIAARGMLGRALPLVVPSALVAAVAVAVIVLAQSRVMLALGLATVLFLMLEPRPAGDRRPLLAFAAYVAIVALAARLIGGGLAQPGDRGAGELVQMLLMLAVAVGGWTLLRRRASAAQPSAPPGPQAPLIRPRAALILLFAGIAVVLVTIGLREGGGIERNSGFTHGREVQWEAAIDVASRHPLIGAGADSYYVASIGDQGRFPVLYAHSLPLEVTAELGLLGLGALIVMLAGVALAISRSRGSPAFWLLAPAAAALPLASIVDWSWHLAGSGALWAIAVGALVASGSPRPPGGALSSPDRTADRH